MTSFLRPLAAAALAAGMLVPGATAGAATGAVDTAIPIWQNGGSAYSTYHGVDCSSSTNNPYYKSSGGGGCKFSLATVTSGSNCLRETITAPTLTPLPLASGPTPCTVIVGGRVDTRSTNGGCMLSAAQTLVVSFSSGVMSAFNSTFNASAIFVPKSVSASDSIKTYHVTLTGGGPTNNGDVTGSGSVMAKFDLTFQTPLPMYCPNADTLGHATMRGPLNRPTSVAVDSSTVTVTI